MAKLEDMKVQIKLSDEARRLLEALERLVPPKGSDSGDLLPDTRSVGGNQSTKNDGSEKPLPDQGGGVSDKTMAFFAWTVWIASSDGQEAMQTLSQSGHVHASQTLLKAFVAGWLDRGDTPLTQSGADGAQAGCPHCGASLADDGRCCVIQCRDANPPKREERSVSGNAAAQPPKGAPL